MQITGIVSCQLKKRSLIAGKNIPDRRIKKLPKYACSMPFRHCILFIVMALLLFSWPLHLSLAQSTRDIDIIPKPNINIPLKYQLPSLTLQQENQLLNPYFEYNGNHLQRNWTFTNFTLDSISDVRKIYFQNTGSIMHYPAFGGYQHFKSDIVFQPANKLTLTLGGSLLRIDTPESPHPSLQYGIQSSVRYAFNSHLSLYLYGQRLWDFSKSQKSSFAIMNPLFPQTEAGAGLSGNMKNIRIDVGPRLIFDTYNNFKNLNIINFRICIRF